jgi:hypothetical protein
MGNGYLVMLWLGWKVATVLIYLALVNCLPE